MLPPWLAEYIGIPFIPNGRTRDGCDCYGLVRLVFSEQLNRQLPLLDNSYTTRDEEERLINKQLPLINAVPTLSNTFGSLVVMSVFNKLSHVGIYVGDDCILHTEKATGSLIANIHSPSFKPRIEGYYRVD